ncbi:MAG: DUF3179 domain-containing protein [Kiritimatiellia bacterium]
MYDRKLLILFGCLFPFFLSAQTLNGFDLGNSSIPVKEMFRGGPPRDGIPSIDEPKFISPDEARFLQSGDEVISVTVGDTTRAYPLRILILHEIVNDTIEDTHFMVTYCPLCGTSMVFNRKIDGQVRSFGVSGLLYNSDVLMYDRETESLWSQLKMEGVSGSGRGKKLEWMTSDLMTWSAWRGKYPEGEVLSTDTGHRRDYNASPYQDYFASNRVMFPVDSSRIRGRLRDKEFVLGVIVGDTPKAYRMEELPKQNGELRDRIQTRDLVIHYDAEAKHARVVDGDGNTVPSVTVYWFAWQAFYPHTRLWEK